VAELVEGTAHQAELLEVLEVAVVLQKAQAERELQAKEQMEAILLAQLLLVVVEREELEVVRLEQPLGLLVQVCLHL
jgi:hypothetical protein